MSSEAIQAAIEKARQVAAKLTQQAPGTEGLKRTADGGGDQPSKKFASISDVVGAQLATLKAQGPINVEEYKCPEKYIGLVIGKGGETIIRLQAESGCKMVLQSDRTGILVLTGTKEAIEKGKKLLDEMTKKTPSEPQLPRGHVVQDMIIPGNKCGLVIGKGGETIKRLAEQYGVKLVVVQDTATPITADKPLRITGEIEKVERVKEAVNQLVNPKEGTKFATNEYGSRPSNLPPGTLESFIKVPNEKAGIVIGKGGDSIKEIKTKSGAHVEIDKNYQGDDGKMFVVKGTFDQIIYAQQLVYEKIVGSPGAQPPHGFFGPTSLNPSDYATKGAASAAAAAAAASAAAANSAAAYQQWAGYYGQDYSKAGAMDPVSQAWAAYYQQYYQQPGVMGAGADATAASTAAPAPTSAAATATTSTPSASASGQTDYSQAWVEYYRSLGMYAEADAILKQTQTAGATTATNGSGTQPSATTGSSTTSSSSTGSSSQSSAAQWPNYAAYAGAYGSSAYQTSQ